MALQNLPIKPASTPTVATDTAAVVALHPSSPIPAGTNIIGAANISTANASATTALHTANATTGLVVGANLPITGYGTALLKITGTFVASLAFKVSQDSGTTWDAIAATQVGAGDIFTVATLPGSYRLTVTGFDLLRVEVTLTSGSITINGKSSNAVNASKIVKLATGANSIGTVSVANFPTSQAVTGTGTVATPATGVVTVQGIAGGAAQPVTGAFFQATQPVSIATNTPDVTDRAARLLGVAIIGAGANSIGTVGVTALPALPAGTNAIGTVSVANLPATQAVATSDGQAGANIALRSAGLWNGTNLDRQRGNGVVFLDNQAYTATAGGTTGVNYNARGGTFVLSVTAVSGTSPSLTMKVQGQDGFTGNFFDIPGAVTAPVTAVGLFTIQIYPGITDTANARVNYALPRAFRCVYTISGTSPSFQLSVGANLIV